MTVRVQWRDPFGRFIEQINDDADKVAYAAAKRGALLSKIYAPKKTLRLASAIFAYRVGRKLAGWKVEGVPYAEAQEKGAQPHLIGSEGKALANPDDNFGPVAGPVRHPGNPATRFMEKARLQIARELITMARKEFKKS
jgi:hypothetical protein